MKVVLQRVVHASVSADNKIIGEIKKGVALLIGIEEGDELADIEWMSKKILNMRIFSDEQGKMNLSLLDIKGDILCVSQFTLIADYKKGNRPSFIKAAEPEKAMSLLETFMQELKKSNLNVQNGQFGADMKVSIINDGPVTIVLNSKTKE